MYIVVMRHFCIGEIIDYSTVKISLLNFLSADELVIQMLFSTLEFVNKRDLFVFIHHRILSPCAILPPQPLI